MSSLWSSLRDDRAPFFLLAGPCVIESLDHCLFMAEAITGVARRLGVPYVFKASFDKANRTSIRSFRGPGLREGLAVLAEVKRRVGVPVVTDIHEAWQAEPVAEVADVLQIPAFLCRQTDLIVAAARTGRVVNLKKGQFMAPEDMLHAVEKVRSTGNEQVMVTERGTTFGYHDLVVDFRSLVVLRRSGVVTVYDATHSLQRPGGAGDRSGGLRDLIAPLARAAVAVGIDGLFMEVHDRPDQALSDAATQFPLDRLEGLLGDLVRIAQIRPSI
ncbi:MAG: 3-deoxy-8-phosphooctulonate synthase [Acidobacteria bacterium]|nr:3-deoxy-8-phosphooctulonate synthase [Acidobacteriota bacterium]MDW7984313.1 3-deoxy-8-phosphooctulonate synthase [Acidobacteriota bacterium]